MDIMRWGFRGVGLAGLATGLWASAHAFEPPRHSAVAPVPRAGPAWFDRYQALNRRVQADHPDLVFIGDSLTQGWETTGRRVWAEFYERRRALNIGIERDATQNLLWRLEHGNVDHIRPRLAVLLIGTNNTGHNTPQEIAQGVAEIVRRLRVRLPATRVIVLGIFPQGADRNHPRRNVGRAANRLISRLHDGRRVFYLDIGQRFVRGDGTIGTDIMPDLLHLSPAGYRIWAEAIEPTVRRLLGERRRATVRLATHPDTPR
ncbi:MAG: GDSL-type esterase/lipase family protein [Gammaproteobacteria bacterium]